jgi:hypothetical protein
LVFKCLPGKEETMRKAGMFEAVLGVVIMALGSTPFWLCHTCLPGLSLHHVFSGVLLLLGVTVGIVVMTFGLIMATFAVGRHETYHRPNRV